MPRSSNKFTFAAKVWLYEGKAAWHFITLPKTTCLKIKRLVGSDSGPWGSVPVTATIGKTKWKTSIFPDRKRNAYLLPLKAAIRKSEKITNGDQLKISLQVHRVESLL